MNCHVMLQYSLNLASLTFTYVESCLALLRNSSALSEEQLKYYTSELLDNASRLEGLSSILFLSHLLRSLPCMMTKIHLLPSMMVPMSPNFIDHTMPSDIARPFLPMFNLHVSSIIDNVQEVKSTALEIVVQNNLPLVRKVTYIINQQVIWSIGIYQLFTIL